MEWKERRPVSNETLTSPSARSLTRPRLRSGTHVLCFLQVALAGVWLYLVPLPKPLFFFPSEVSPRASRCLWTGAAIQLIRASRRIALWDGLSVSEVRTSRAERDSCRQARELLSPSYPHQTEKNSLDEDNFVVLVDTVLVDPVRVESECQRVRVELGRVGFGFPPPSPCPFLSVMLLGKI